MKFTLILLLLSQISMASFSENQVRYFSGPELQWYLFQLGIVTDQNACLDFSGSHASSFGVNNASTGGPSSQSPTVSTVGAIAFCIKNYFSRIQGQQIPADIQGILFSTHLIAVLNQKYSSYWHTKLWSELDPVLQQKLIEHFIFHILGPDAVIDDYKLVVSAAELKNDIKKEVELMKSQKVFEVLEQLTLSLVLRDESLSF